MTNTKGEIIQSLCNSCRHETRHEIIWQHTLERNDKGVLQTIVVSQAVFCCGCKEFSFRKENWSEGITSGRPPVGRPDSIDFKPARLWHHPPNWLESLEDIDLKGILDEVYLACNDQQTRLLSMGIRSVLDHVMTLILKGDVGSFREKLNAMVTAGNLTQKQCDNIDIVIDAGSASSHRAFRPPVDLLKEMVVVMENIVREHYITGPMLQTMKTVIPPKPARIQKPKK